MCARGGGWCPCHWKESGVCFKGCREVAAPFAGQCCTSGEERRGCLGVHDDVGASECKSILFFGVHSLCQDHRAMCMLDTHCVYVCILLNSKHIMECLESEGCVPKQSRALRHSNRLWRGHFNKYCVLGFLSTWKETSGFPSPAS